MEYFPKAYVIGDPQEDPGRLARSELLNMKILKDGSSSCPCSMTSNGQREEIQNNEFQIPKK